MRQGLNLWLSCKLQVNGVKVSNGTLRQNKPDTRDEASHK